MTRHYFGTDGIRGTANQFPMTPDIAMKAAMAVGLAFRSGGHRHRAVIGKDTRLSGYMLEYAMVAGFAAVGVDVFLLGPIPTPAVAEMTRTLKCDIGVMISASHNPFADNGIKIFGSDGFKLSDDIEREIEAMIESDLTERLQHGTELGRAKRIEGATERYIEYIKSTLPRSLSFAGTRVVIDCANGAAYKVAPAVLWELGAEVVSIGVEPNGTNINDNVGSTAPGQLIAKVRELRADVGIALDGDADRLIMVDETGTVIDGDQLMATMAISLKQDGLLSRPAIVATIMSNLGLERYLAGEGIELLRSRVGDRYVLEKMRESHCNFGGEQSGHLILSDHASTGDGLLAAMQIMAAHKRAGQPLSQFCRRFTPVPQILKNVRFKDGQPLDEPVVRQTIAEAVERLSPIGRLVVRPSGTEPLIRVMGEGDDENLVGRVVEDVCSAIRKAAA